LGLVLVVALGAATVACGGGSSSGEKGFCDELKTQRQSTSSVSDADAAKALDRLASLAPSEIKSEMDQIRQYNALVTQSASSDPAKAAEIDSSLSSQSSQIDAAIAKVATFVKDKCGIDLTPSSSKFSTVASSIN
jgi:hypothetical protein